MRRVAAVFLMVMLASATVARAQSIRPFYRFFPVPGMAHCGGGAGPNTFDALAALEAWVERGTAPASIPASHATNGQIDRTRPLCAYPAVARYKGAGSVDDAANFVCAAR